MANSIYQYNMNSRTAGGPQNGQFKTIQAWKTIKTPVSTQADKPINTRTASTISPATKSTPNAQQEILANLEKAAEGKVGRFDVKLQTSLAYADAGQRIDNEINAPQSTEAFQFDDVVDMVNPLQHLPLVNMVYRGLTGDKIHPMAQIIGGAIFGGPVGALTGTANAISQIQTGKDIGEHALEMAGLTRKTNNSPIEKLNKTTTALKQKSSLEGLPGSALSFVNLSEPNRSYERIKIADGRTAGSMIVENKMVGYRQSINTRPISNIASQAIEGPVIDTTKLPAREGITTIEISTMPPKQDV